ncbi:MULTISPECIES: histidine triad nucleotide-binding protein [Paenibacillus]|uniref:Hydrolase n=1 Tax=Paenibacillus naphthalenovorans TaxID=162209 RepID=A0A0U2U4X9_9BACL|nr:MULTISPECIES: histidine triad nucleotide-binding protein [Paenibacillus]ALS21304.1 hydrolase [Paenibacillus naphthalenovorans]NTZ18535.1 histidine triad nucleotide-binding protein [Paenibacillus sp. JMULE4]GCL72559.1 histidine triad nucleotide-binding protein [Paenibacillus naphthalenovorans]SDH97445.1 histidine triad (HIT) family protein [Paenibacillus naphthalenovorans]
MDCIFCKIVEGAIPSKKVFENEHVVAFHDIQPAAPVHILIIPKKHISSMNDVESEDWYLLGEIHSAAQQIAREQGVAETGYRLINNCGPDSGQVVFHIHYHLLGGEKLGALNAR